MRAAARSVSSSPITTQLSYVHHGSRRLFSSSPARRADFTHAVIGGGVVGLAIARNLSQRSPNTLLLERHNAIGTETSSRNSEVIHAGIYYGRDSLKTQLCIRGKDLLYSFCDQHEIPYKRCGKWIVAQNDAQLDELDKIWKFCKEEINVPIDWLNKQQAAEQEPAVRVEAGVLHSPTTGIIDSHALMTTLLGHFEDNGGTVSLGSTVTHITPLPSTGLIPGDSGWEITVRDPTGDESTITADSIINAAGLGAVHIHNMIVPEERHKKMYYAKGNYFSYPASAITPRVKTPIYPAPEPGHGGLGTHLTLDLGGRIKFGPDVEWVDSPNDLSVNTSRLPQAVEEIKKYLPSLDEKLLVPDYAGIRPKLGKQSAVAHGRGFVDFYIEKEAGYQGWVNLLGIESPGLTSSLAIGEKVAKMLYT
ncbi:putative mitochondrial L-2-hydroxyglutarate dehydrogenase [Diplogelasinospora grovesii]|uniref:L-2-hydroxyglutarate dehydrogenase, mitochondrial n=1 Tax=Diplogelasinospora grovesii TaxID=303347 RepID=A0AAN6S8G1_9PEZI|nr:putative mitochondrial L-2-hydroxyglutarate dehydrogenase [Diplogelasinospora grovesii]